MITHVLYYLPHWSSNKMDAILQTTFSNTHFLQWNVLYFDQNFNGIYFVDPSWYRWVSKKDVTPLLMHWSYVFLTLTHRYEINTGMAPDRPQTISRNNHDPVRWRIYASLSLNASCKLPWTRSSLVQVLPCRMFGDEPLCEPMLSDSHLDLCGQT